MSPVPPATSMQRMGPLRPGLKVETKVSFHSLCTPRDVASFIRSYLDATLSKTPFTRDSLDSSGTVLKPNEAVRPDDCEPPGVAWPWFFRRRIGATSCLSARFAQRETWLSILDGRGKLGQSQYPEFPRRSKTSSALGSWCQSSIVEMCPAHHDLQALIVTRFSHALVLSEALQRA